jgi:hypothetical protein
MMTDDGTNPGSLDPTWADLALALTDCRDALTDLSLSLRDHLFDLDTVHRQSAWKMAQALPEKIKEQVGVSRR